jgi:starch synthase
MLTREFPPEVYGGAGVHAAYLARELGHRVDLAVHAFGRPRQDPAVQSHPQWNELATANPALQAMSVDLSFAASARGADLVHSHTWYANLGGHLAKLLYGVPHVMTAHSLEPLRPWKAEQLGGGYALSSFCERTAIEAADAVIAVSESMRRDVTACYPGVAPERVTVIHNGIDATEYSPDRRTDVLDRYGVDPSRPIVLFVGRITRQKGVGHLLAAAHHLDPAAQLVVCAGAPDTPEIGAEVRRKLTILRSERHDVVWIEAMLPRSDAVALLSHALVFVCPSVYEPMGIVNLEAMACEAAVVATAVGGIPEVVADGETGLLVPIDALDEGSGEPCDPDRFARDLADRVNALLAAPERARAMGLAGRRRALTQFSWPAVAARTVELYESLIS